MPTLTAISPQGSIGLLGQTSCYGKIISVKATGLKPSTTYLFYNNNQDISAQCHLVSPQYKKFGESLVSGPDGTLSLAFYPGITVTNYNAAYIPIWGVKTNPYSAASTPMTTAYWKWAPFSTANFKLVEASTLRPAAQAQAVSTPAPAPAVVAPAPANQPPKALPVPTSSSKTTVATSTKTTYNGGTPLSAISLFFDYIQTFYVDPNAVKNVSKVSLTGVDLWVRLKPPATNNKSGIKEPGIAVYICEVENGIPNLSKVYIESLVRKQYSEINASPDATLVTEFRFKSPVTLKSGAYYGIIINFEDPDYSLWSATEGQLLLEKNTPAAGAYADGSLFRSTNFTEQASIVGNADYFKPVKNTDLKFQVHIKKYDISQPLTFELVNDDYEFLTINDIVAGQTATFSIGERVYQDHGNTTANVTFYKTGLLSVNAASKTILGVGTQFTADLKQDDTIVITDGTLGNTDIRRIQDIDSNTKLVLDDLPSFSNSSARYKLTAVGRIHYIRYSSNTIFLDESNANSTVRFSNSGIKTLTLNAGGTGYANTDYLKTVGCGATINAVCNITTNSTGGIISINISNTGSGFTSAPETSNGSLAILKSDGTGSNGSTANIVAIIGSKLVSEISESTANVTGIINYDVDSFIPDIQIDLKSGSTVNTTYNFAFANGAEFVVSSSNEQEMSLTKTVIVDKYKALLLSKSIEAINYNKLYDGKSGIIKITFQGTNEFESPEVSLGRLGMFSFQNYINNDDTNENTRDGNAYSKHISTKINFANNRFAEDIRVISTLYKPANTDVKMYAKIYNTRDDDAFDDKEWTELEVVEGAGSFSSLADPEDYIEMSWGFPQFPNTSLTVTGGVVTELANAEIAGIVGTTSFNTELANNDLIKIYDPLFANTNYVIAVVNTVTNATHLSIKNAISNNGVVGSGIAIDKLAYKHTAFNNITNDNVVRYYNSGMIEFDTYDVFAIKIVMLSPDTHIVPRVDDVRAIGVSA